MVVSPRRRCAGDFALKEQGEKLDDLRNRHERDVRYANITIFGGHDASHYAIGIVSTRIAKMVLRDEHPVIPMAAINASSASRDHC